MDSFFTLPPVKNSRINADIQGWTWSAPIILN